LHPAASIGENDNRPFTVADNPYPDCAIRHACLSADRADKPGYRSSQHSQKRIEKVRLLYLIPF